MTEASPQEVQGIQRKLSGVDPAKVTENQPYIIQRNPYCHKETCEDVGNATENVSMIDLNMVARTGRASCPNCCPEMQGTAAPESDAPPAQ